MNNNRGIITIAVGKKYTQQAKYLAMSCMIHSPWITRSVITDQIEALSKYYDIVIPYEKKFGQPFSLKLQLPRFTPFAETLYIDSDSLVMNNIDSLWDFLDDRSFAYEGKTHTTGVWYYDITKAMAQLKAPWIPIFNSGMFLFKNDKDAQNIFDTAYAMMTGENNMEIGYFRKNMLPDEPYFAASFALNNVWPIERSNEYGRSSHTLINAKKIRINVVKGISSFIKDGTYIFPLIVHFCGRLGNIYYAREKIRLLFYTR